MASAPPRTRSSSRASREPRKARSAKAFRAWRSTTPTPLTECPAARFDADGALINADEAVGELVNTTGTGFFTGYYNDEEATAERMRHGMYWSGDLAYRDADGWIYLAGRTADWMRVDGENMAAAPIERILVRCPTSTRSRCMRCPTNTSAIRSWPPSCSTTAPRLTPAGFEAFLAAQPDLSPKAWPRYVRITADLPTTATHKVLKRDSPRRERPPATASCGCASRAAPGTRVGNG